MLTPPNHKKLQVTDLPRESGQISRRFLRKVGSLAGDDFPTYALGVRSTLCVFSLKVHCRRSLISVGPFVRIVRLVRFRLRILTSRKQRGKQRRMWPLAGSG